jgi:hypothetical protein
MFLQNISTYLPNYTVSYRNLLLKYGLNNDIWMFVLCDVHLEELT